MVISGCTGTIYNVLLCSGFDSQIYFREQFNFRCFPKLIILYFQVEQVLVGPILHGYLTFARVIYFNYNNNNKKNNK